MSPLKIWGNDLGFGRWSDPEVDDMELDVLDIQGIVYACYQ
jgi:hypothetical protein